MNGSPRATLRQQLTRYLELGEHAPRELATTFETTVKAILEELDHVRRTAGKRFTIRPAICSACEYTFKGRDRLSTPSRCPKCRSERIDGPWLSIGE